MNDERGGYSCAKLEKEYMGNQLSIVQIPEYKISLSTHDQLKILLDRIFPNVEFGDRIYFKQSPHFRFLAMDSARVIGN